MQKYSTEVEGNAGRAEEQQRNIYSTRRRAVVEELKAEHPKFKCSTSSTYSRLQSNHPKWKYSASNICSICSRKVEKLEAEQDEQV